MEIIYKKKMKKRNIFVCSECGYQSVRWLGKCPNCGQWNTFIEEVITEKRNFEKIVKPSKITDIKIEEFPRLKTKIGEFDRVVGGGIVYGSLNLLAGHPGIGKSTLLLTIAGKVSDRVKVLYVSAEESPNQIKMRADRLDVKSENLYILSTTDMVSIKKSLEDIKPEFVIIDSIQTVFDPEIPTTPGSVTQVRENSNYFLQYSKEKNCSIFLVGHITKEGAIAGPKVLEHLVDVVLYFEGETRSNLRILRSIKNRFGPTTEIGVFSMGEAGLEEIPEAAAIFLPEKTSALPGSVIFPSQEGRRTLLVEIQALVTPSYYGVPKRSATGIDYNRISLILAVLEKKLHFHFNTYDVYVNVGGGLKITEPASDLAVAISCVSSLKEINPVEKCIVMGEIALTGEIRPVSQIELRIKEAKRLGFTRAILPESNRREIKEGDMEFFPVKWLKEAIDLSLNLT